MGTNQPQRPEPAGTSTMAAPLPPGVKLLRTLRGHEDWIAKIAWSPDGRTLASPSGDKTIRLWDAETVRICLHGDLHEARRELVSHWLPNKLHVIGAGSFGATAADRPASTPRLYNLLEIRRDLRSVRVHTRCQPRPDGPWKGWNEWPHPKVGGAAVSYYDIDW